MHSFLLNKKQKVEMLNYKDYLLTKSLASLSRRRGTEGEALLGYNYPGNVRELQYTIERAVIMADENVLQARDLIFSHIEMASVWEQKPSIIKVRDREKYKTQNVI